MARWSTWRFAPPSALLLLGACTDPDFAHHSCRDVEGSCISLPAEDPQGLLDAVNLLDPDTTVVLGAGTFRLDNQVTLRAAGLTMRGQGMGETVLDFADQASQSNGIDVVGDRFLLEDLTVLDARGDAVRIEDSDGVVLRRVEATWTNESDPTNGPYGLYPVKVTNVLVEDCEASNASDAGIYVGQARHAIVRNNRAHGNVAGLEIENTQYADVYGNEVTDNTGGLLVFDLPGNPIVGRDIRIYENVVSDNNRPNFAPGGMVRAIPAGTGTFALASRRVEIFDNTYEDNGTVDVAVLSGLAVVSSASSWGLSPDALLGDWEDLDLVEEGDTVFNYRTEEIRVYDNHHANTGTRVDAGEIDQDCFFGGEDCHRPLGLLIALTWADEDVDAILYDTIGESAFDPESPSGNSNDNHLCLGPSSEATFASMNLPDLAGHRDLDRVYRPASPFAPFDCDALTGGPVEPVTLEGLGGVAPF